MTSRLQEIDGWFCAPGAVVAGDIRIGAGCSIWFGAVLRGDDAQLVIEERVNVQDNAVVHPDIDADMLIESDVTIGHLAMVHGRRIGRGSLIGIGSVILPDVTIGSGCLIGARALLTPGTSIPDGAVVLGAPGRIVRETTAEERARFIEQAHRYADKARRWVAGEYRSLSDPR